MTPGDLGPYVQGFFLDYLGTQKGLRPSSIRAYRDGFRLFLTFVADDRRCAVSRIRLDDLTVERAQRFLHFLEYERHNHIRTRNHRRAVLVSFFEYLARRAPGRLAVCQQVAGIPVKRVAPPETRFLERADVDFATLIWPTLIPKFGPPATLTDPCRSQRDRGGLVGQESPRGIIRRDSTGVPVRHRDD